MFKQTATDLTLASSKTIETWLNSFDTVLSDCDGEFIFNFIYSFLATNLPLLIFNY